ncbi:Mov34-domain-containing protein [Lentinula edodes]|uniref:Eukaryotic translation initiation factor 3 subunit F n=1 Tax=Lentinula edodes TaxID=5353 RepID=A0A1Q3EPM0_LENED|nr:JAB1/Mov34/MPN/PAD-1 ubiquitin protease-domain-containing protein [Lentinula edodes]GAW09153.1 Mov34-domain-containing protein [Lentinula edodes]
MPLGPPSSAINIQPAVSSLSQNVPRTPTSISIHPVALFSILDHYLRRKDDQDRVIGTLLGTRTETHVEIRTSFAVLHSETSEQVAVDMDYHRTMYELHRKVNSKEVIVGWYSTGSNLNTYSALIQNFYSQETAPHQAVHISLDTGVEPGQPAGVKGYISSPVGVFPKPENCVFVPIPVELKFRDSERSGVDLLTSTALSSLPSTSSSSLSSPTTSLETLSSSIENIISMIDRVLTYVRAVLAGEAQGDAAIGRYLMDILGASTEGDADVGGSAAEMGGFNGRLQDTLMVSYLANLVRAQAEVSSRLALVSAA